MSFLATLINSPIYIYFPQSLWGSLVTISGLLFFTSINIALWWKWKGYDKPRSRRSWGIFTFLGVLVPFTSLFIGLRLPVEGALPLPGVAVEPVGPAMMVFSTIPWTLAGGLLGPTYAALIALFSGLLVAAWDTHSLFTPLELVLLALLFSAAVNQRYRTRFYELLRHPVVTAFLLGSFYPLVFMISSSLAVEGNFAVRFDYALNRLWIETLAMGSMLLIGGLVAELVRIAYPSIWGRLGVLDPSPFEISLQARFSIIIIPIALMLTLALMVGDWWVAESASRKLLRERMSEVAQITSEGVPYFLEAGQNLIQQLASDPRLANNDPEQIREVLSEDLRTLPFFTQLFILDEGGNSLSGYPDSDYLDGQASAEEQMGIQLALDGIPFQAYSIPPEDGNLAAQVSFITPLFNPDESVQGVLIGRTDLILNPFTKPILMGLQSLAGQDGVGMLLDEKGRILYHPNPDLIMSVYTGLISDKPRYYEDTGPDGTRRLVYYQPALGRPWVIVLEIPAQRAQQLALQIAIPLLGMILVLAFITAFLLRVGIKKITGSLQELAQEADQIAQGKLDKPMPLGGIDEVGQLRRAFEQMRLSLKLRLDELQQLLMVSQGVASSLEVSEAIRPVLDSALKTGACSARVVISPSVLPNLEENDPFDHVFSSGSAKDAFGYLDNQILRLTSQQDRIVLSNPIRPKLINFEPGHPQPMALVAVALRRESHYYGSFWVAYDQPHVFSEEEVRYFFTLAGQAALAVSNSSLFLNAEIGRQQLASILASTPDPVLVTDNKNRLLLANPAAWRVLGLGTEWQEGEPIDRIISQPELIELLSSSMDGKRSLEITLADKEVYYATATTVFAEGKRMGRVCVLRDITYFKELDAHKSEFVATVSHDLRSPLTLMRGYATMLEMVGELSQQQRSYVQKIMNSVENMSHLVNNLLDLGRIEAGVDLQLEMVSMNEVIDRVISTFQLHATQQRVHLETDHSAQGLPMVEVDPALIQQAIQNLVDNAIKFTDPGGKVLVRAFVRDEMMVIEVTDTGIGIAPVDQPRLYEKFFRGGYRLDKKQSGSGLGLAIVKSITDRHSGQTWFESQLGKGSSFYMSIPLRQKGR